MLAFVNAVVKLMGVDGLHHGIGTAAAINAVAATVDGRNRNCPRPKLRRALRLAIGQGRVTSTQNRQRTRS
jgi:hypothetical protein